VVCDAALGGSSLSWTLVEPAVRAVTRMCTYDRAGFGWSDAGPLPRTAGRIADELHEALTRAAVSGPFLLVGHSYGGLVMRLFAARHPSQVAGLVLIEPAVPEDWVNPSAELRAHMNRGVRLCGYGTTAARLGIARAVSLLASTGALTAARSIVKVVSRGGLRREDEGILAPIWRLPPDVRRLLRGMWIQPKFFDALRSQIETICESAAEVLREAPARYGNLPLVVITAASADEYRLQADASLARSSFRGRHVLAPASGHWVPLDAPDVVSDAIIAAVRALRHSP
jgi:pimeloyl-ACP methyl ester carboxylesterase